jgi:hypothetical protein
MRGKDRATIAALIVACAALAGCSGTGGEPRLMNIRANTQSPDEFAILPTKPLEMPASFAQLPEPTPGGRNRVDPTPAEDAVAALGGNHNAGRGGIPAADGALVAHVARYGVSPSIRPELAAADLEYRRANDGRLLERLFNVNVYYRAYEAMSLDQHLELERWRAAGARTPSAPPDARLIGQNSQPR